MRILKYLTPSIFFIATIFIAFPCYCEGVRPAMDNMSVEIEALKPFLLNPELFLSNQNEKDILKHIINFKNYAEDAKHAKSYTQGDYRKTITLLIDHLNETQKTFKRGHKELARYMLQSSIQTCISCHSRLPGYENTLSILKKDPHKVNSFSEAEFLFATRDFTQALLDFTRFAEGYPKNKIEMYQLLDSLDYIAAIFARIKRDPKSGSEVFSKLSKSGNFPPFVQEDVKNWIKAFRAWEKEPEFRLDKHTDQEVLAKANEILGGSLEDPLYQSDRSKRVAFLRASTLLHEFVTARPTSSLAADAYYLLGVCYISLKSNFFIGFDQMYLRTCIKDYPKNPVARKCYNLLEESIYLGHTGSSGTHVPYDVIQDLNQYKKYVY